MNSGPVVVKAHNRNDLSYSCNLSVSDTGCEIRGDTSLLALDSVEGGICLFLMQGLCEIGRKYMLVMARMCESQNGVPSHSV